MPAASQFGYDLLFYLVVTFILTTKQEADAEAINTARYLDKNLTWQQFTLKSPSQMQESACDLIKHNIKYLYLTLSPYVGTVGAPGHYMRKQKYQNDQRKGASRVSSLLSKCRLFRSVRSHLHISISHSQRKLLIFSPKPVIPSLSYLSKHQQLSTNIWNSQSLESFSIPLPLSSSKYNPSQNLVSLPSVICPFPQPQPWSQSQHLSSEDWNCPHLESLWAFLVTCLYIQPIHHTTY